MTGENVNLKIFHMLFYLIL